MKILTSILTLSFFLTFSNCKQSSQKISEEDAKIGKSDVRYPDSNKTAGKIMQTNDEIKSCQFESNLNNPKTPKLAKDIYFDNEWDLNNVELIGLLDSLTAKDKISRPFYFKVITKSYKKSDGYYSEGLGGVGKDFVENYTKDFAEYFQDKNCFPYKDLETWVDIVMLEFALLADNEFDKSLIDNYNEKLKLNCKNCTPPQRKTVDTFISLLNFEWNERLKNK